MMIFEALVVMVADAHVRTMTRFVISMKSHSLSSPSIPWKSRLSSASTTSTKAIRSMPRASTRANVVLASHSQVSANPHARSNPGLALKFCGPLRIRALTNRLSVVRRRNFVSADHSQFHC